MYTRPAVSVLLLLLIAVVSITSDGAVVTVTLNSDSKVPLNATPTFSCLTSGTIIQWTNSHHQIIKADRKFKFSSQNRNLAIFNIQKSDEGSYYCHVRTTDGQNHSASAKVDVIVPPIVQAHSATILEGKEAVLRCTGQHFFTVFWKFNGAAVQLDSNFALLGKEAQELKIKSASRAYNGTYTCEAANSRFKTAAYPQLIVDYAPNVTASHDQKVGIGYEIHFECNITGNPRPTLSWQHEGRDLDFSSGKYIIKQADVSHTLTIEKVEMSDSGTYTCLVNNKYGSESASCHLNVIADLVWDAAPALKTVLLDTNDTLSCKAGGYRTSQIHWKKDGQQLEFSSSSKISMTPSGALVITRAGYNESGVYKCEVSNSEGTWNVRQDITVTVRGPPLPPVIRHAFVTNQSQLYLEWSSPLFDGNTPVTAYRVCSRHREQSHWCNTSFPSTRHSATVDCFDELGHNYILVVAVNNHGEGESAIQDIHFLEHPKDVRYMPTDRSQGQTPNTDEIDDANVSHKSSESDSFGIGPLIGVSVVAGLVIAGIILSFILIRRKLKVLEHRVEQPAVVPRRPDAYSHNTKGK